MNINLTYTDRMVITSTDTLDNGQRTYDFENKPVTLEDAINYANDLWEYSDFNHSVITSATTGEVLAICDADDDDRENFDEADLECGFDAYEGCYTFDC